MKVQTSENPWLPFAPNAVIAISMEWDKTYKLEPTVIKSNVRMIAIAACPPPDSYGEDVSYVYHDFSSGKPFEITPSKYPEYGFATLYLMAMLELSPISGGYLIGSGDGERGFGGSTGDSAGYLKYDQSASPKLTQVHPSSGSSIALPPFLQDGLVAGQDFIGISPNYNKPWLDVYLGTNNQNQIALQQNAVIQLNLMAEVHDIEDLYVIDSSKPDAGSIDLRLGPDFMYDKARITAFIHPELINGEYVFQLGDPQKDGSIKLQTV